MGKKLDALFGKSFKSSKCCSLLKMIVNRIRLLKNKREIQCSQYKKDIALLLQKGQVASSRSRVELLFKEQNILSAYTLIEGFCYLVQERILSIEKTKTCPNDLKEAIASLIYAAPRCADLPELQDIRAIITSKYGTEFVTAAIELQTDSGVNRQIIEHLSVKTPTDEVKLWLMKEVAAENGINWDIEKAEREMLKPADEKQSDKNKPKVEHIDVKQSDSVQVKSTPQSIKTESIKTVHTDTDAKLDTEPPLLPVIPSRIPSGNSRVSDGVAMNKIDMDRPSPVKSTLPEGSVYNKLRVEGKMDYTTGTNKETRHEYNDADVAAEVAFASAVQATEAAQAAIRLAKRENLKNKHRTSRSEITEVDSENELDNTLLAVASMSISGAERERLHTPVEHSNSRKSFRNGCQNNSSGYPDLVNRSDHGARKISASSNGAEVGPHAYSTTRKPTPTYNDDDQQRSENGSISKEETCNPYRQRRLHDRHNYIERAEKVSLTSSASNTSVNSYFAKAISDQGIEEDNNTDYRNDDTNPNRRDEYEHQKRHWKSRQREGSYPGYKFSRDSNNSTPDSWNDQPETPPSQASYESSHRSGVPSSKPTFEKFLRQQTQSFDYFDPKIDDGAKSLHEFERIKFQSHHKPPSGRRHPSSKDYDNYGGKGLRAVASVGQIAGSESAKKVEFEIGERRFSASDIVKDPGNDEVRYEGTEEQQRTVRNSRQRYRSNVQRMEGEHSVRPQDEGWQQDRDGEYGMERMRRRGSDQSVESFRSSRHEGHSRKYKSVSSQEDLSNAGNDSSRSSSRTRPSPSPTSKFTQSKVNLDSLFDPRTFMDSPPRERRQHKSRPKNASEGSDTSPYTDEDLYARFEALKRKH